MRRANASNAGVIISDGGDDPGQPGAMAMGITLAVRASEDRGARIDVASEVWMGSVNPGVEDSNEGGIGRLDRTKNRVPADLRQGPLATIEGV